MNKAELQEYRDKVNKIFISWKLSTRQAAILEIVRLIEDAASQHYKLGMADCKKFNHHTDWEYYLIGNHWWEFWKKKQVIFSVNGIEVLKVKV